MKTTYYLIIPLLRPCRKLCTRLGWGKCRLDCFIGMLLALLRLKHINLSQLALAFASGADPDSRYRRLQRFFQEVAFDYDAVAQLIMGMFAFHDKSYYLTPGRANWKWGGKNLNILSLGIVYKGAAVAVYWLVLNKQGTPTSGSAAAFWASWATASSLAVTGGSGWTGRASLI